MINLIAVFFGGGLGAVLRYLTGVLSTRFVPFYTFPVVTLSVNILGSFILGFAFAFFLTKVTLQPYMKLAVTVGFCGGLTTFSTFSFEVFDMFKSGNIIYGMLYILLSLAGCVLATYFGFKTGKIF